MRGGGCPALCRPASPPLLPQCQLPQCPAHYVMQFAQSKLCICWRACPPCIPVAVGGGFCRHRPRGDAPRSSASWHRGHVGTWPIIFLALLPKSRSAFGCLCTLLLLFVKSDLTLKRSECRARRRYLRQTVTFRHSAATGPAAYGKVHKRETRKPRGAAGKSPTPGRRPPAAPPAPPRRGIPCVRPAAVRTHHPP